jgi:hypothetical protein
VVVVVGENNMNFKTYYENREAILEASQINMGDFTEVIFAVGLLQYALKKQVSVDDIFNAINDIPSLPYENTFNHNNYDVALHLEGKAGVSNLIGGNFKTLSPEQQTQVRDIIEKVANNIPKLRTIHKVDKFLQQTRELPNADQFSIVIKSSGSKSAQQKETKADVTMELVSNSEVKIPNDIKKIVYSIKYEKEKKTSKVAETSIFNLILRLGNAFKLPLTKGLENMRVLPHQVNSAAIWLFNTFGDGPRVVLTPEQEINKELSFRENHLYNFIRKYFTLDKGDKTKVVTQFLLEFNSEMLVKEKQQPAFSNVLYDFLEKEIFGQDLVDVVKIDISGIREIDVEAYNKIRNTCLVDFSTRPTKSKNLIFEFEAVAKDGGRFRLFWIDNEPTGVKIHIGEDLLK